MASCVQKATLLVSVKEDHQDSLMKVELTPLADCQESKLIVWQQQVRDTAILWTDIMH